MLRRQASSIARNTAPESAIDLSIMSAATKASIPQNLRSIDKRLLLAERAYKQNPVLAMRGVAATSLGLGNSICLSGSQRQNIVGKPFVPVGIASMLPPPFNSNGQLAPVIPTRALPVQPRLSSRHQQPNNMSTSSNGVSSPLDSSLVASLRKRGNSIGNSSQPT